MSVAATAAARKSAKSAKSAKPAKPRRAAGTRAAKKAAKTAKPRTAKTAKPAKPAARRGASIMDDMKTLVDLGLYILTLKEDKTPGRSFNMKPDVPPQTEEDLEPVRRRLTTEGGPYEGRMAILGTKRSSIVMLDDDSGKDGADTSKMAVKDARLRPLFNMWRRKWLPDGSRSPDYISRHGVLHVKDADHAWCVDFARRYKGAIVGLEIFTETKWFSYSGAYEGGSPWWRNDGAPTVVETTKAELEAIFAELAPDAGAAAEPAAGEPAGARRAEHKRILAQKVVEHPGRHDYIIHLAGDLIWQDGRGRDTDATVICREIRRRIRQVMPTWREFDPGTARGKKDIEDVVRDFISKAGKAAKNAPGARLDTPAGVFMKMVKAARDANMAGGGTDAREKAVQDAELHVSTGKRKVAVAKAAGNMGDYEIEKMALADAQRELAAAKKWAARTPDTVIREAADEIVKTCGGDATGNHNAAGIRGLIEKYMDNIEKLDKKGGVDLVKAFIKFRGIIVAHRTDDTENEFNYHAYITEGGGGERHWTPAVAILIKREADRLPGFEGINTRGAQEIAKSLAADDDTHNVTYDTEYRRRLNRMVIDPYGAYFDVATGRTGTVDPAATYYENPDLKIALPPIPADGKYGPGAVTFMELLEERFGAENARIVWDHMASVFLSGSLLGAKGKSLLLRGAHDTWKSFIIEYLPVGILHETAVSNVPMKQLSEDSTFGPGTVINKRLNYSEETAPEMPRNQSLIKDIDTKEGGSVRRMHSQVLIYAFRWPRRIDGCNVQPPLGANDDDNSALIRMIIMETKTVPAKQRDWRKLLLNDAARKDVLAALLMRAHEICRDISVMRTQSLEETAAAYKRGMEGDLAEFIDMNYDRTDEGTGVDYMHFRTEFKKYSKINMTPRVIERRLEDMGYMVTGTQQYSIEDPAGRSRTYVQADYKTEGAKRRHLLLGLKSKKLAAHTPDISAVAAAAADACTCKECPHDDTMTCEAKPCSCCMSVDTNGKNPRHENPPA